MISILGQSWNLVSGWFQSFLIFKSELKSGQNQVKISLKTATVNYPIVELGLQAYCCPTPYIQIMQEANTSCHCTDAIILSFVEYHSFKHANQLQLILALSHVSFLLHHHSDCYCRSETSILLSHCLYFCNKFLPCYHATDRGTHGITELSVSWWISSHLCPFGLAFWFLTFQRRLHTWLLFHIDPICHCMRPTTTCRIVRQMPAFALSVTILCAVHLTGYAMICYIKAPHDCMLQKTHLIFALPVLGSDFLHFRGGSHTLLSFHMSLHKTHYKLQSCETDCHITSFCPFGHTPLCRWPSYRKCHDLSHASISQLCAFKNTSSFQKWLQGVISNRPIYTGTHMMVCLHKSWWCIQMLIECVIICGYSDWRHMQQDM